LAVNGEVDGMTDEIAATTCFRRSARLTDLMGGIDW